MTPGVIIKDILNKGYLYDYLIEENKTLASYFCKGQTWPTETH